MPEIASRSTFKILTPSDPTWRALFERLPADQQDIFYTPEYADIAARFLHKDGRVACAVLESGSDFVLYPFLQRDIQTLLSDMAVQTPDRDIHGLYGRGGLVVSTQEPQLIEKFHASFEAYCRDNRILCGFDRYHPVLENQKMASAQTKLIDVGGFIVLDLQKPLEQIERAYKHSVRKHIKKAVRAGVQVFSESNLDHLEAFLAIYTKTMQRNEARDFYYVEPEFYKEISTQLPDGFRFFYATLDGAPVSCELVLIQGHYMHSFLGGTLQESLEKCPNHLLKQEIVRYAHANGCRYYLLGGGVTTNDGIWAYKQCFAQEGNRPSYVGGAIFNEAAYTGLKEELSRKGVEFPHQRFQFYDRH